MIYTCYEMIRDCRADKPEGWRHFISNYIPVICKVVDHYAPDRRGDVGAIVKFLRRPDSALFQSLEPAPERWFVAELRQQTLGQLKPREPQTPLDLETLTGAYEPLTLTEKQAVWLDAMGYDVDVAGPMMRMAPATVAKIRERADELLRVKIDVWRKGILRDNGRTLDQAASAGLTEKCQTAKVFLDILDGRTTWYGRESMDMHVRDCWHCVDLYCRMVEVIHLLRGIKPLSEAEAAPYYELLGVQAKKKRWFGA